MATLRVMEQRGKLDPDVGYWAERWDPEGRLHPLYYTSHIDGKWVNVTTLPALYAAYPLFRVAGYRGALLVPMAGAVLAALAARALARRMGAGEGWGWAAFWIVGLASPLTVYALDFWEHSLGVGLVAWGVVLLVDTAAGGPRGRGGPGGRPGGRWWRALGAGLLFGAAATMRTEALVYGAVATAATLLVVLWRGRKVLPPLAMGVAALVGLAVPLVGNVALERATIGAGLRAERAAGTVLAAGTPSGPSRVEEALLTGLSLDPSSEPASYLVGAALLGLLVLAARRARRTSGGSNGGSNAASNAASNGPGGSAGDDLRMARLALVGVGALYLLRFAGGLGFVPGLIAATPLAAVGLARAWDGTSSRLLAGIALAALPAVWATQFTGGAAPQWAGRYVLASGFLLAVVGVVALPRLDRRAVVALVTLSAVVTAFGLGWLSVRSHDVGRSGAALARRPEPVLVSRIAHLAREHGWYTVERRWLTALSDDDVADAARVVSQAGFDRFALVELDLSDPPPAVPGFAPLGFDRLEFISGVPLRVTTFVKLG